MSYFRVTDVWSEKVGQRAAGKVRFEKLDLHNLSWWAPDDSPPPLPLSERQCSMEPETHTCTACGKESRRVYSVGWMCLQSKCSQYWTIGGTQPQDVTFDPGFLNYRTPPDSTYPSCDLVPDLLSTFNEDNFDITSARIAWKGIICPKCNKCISRRFWRGWKCADDIAVNGDTHDVHCEFEEKVRMRTVSLRTVIEDVELSPVRRPLLNHDPKMAAPEVDNLSLYPYSKLTYNIAGIGSVTHFVANRSINSRQNGPDDLFKQLQEADLGLRRYPLQQSVGE